MNVRGIDDLQEIGRGGTAIVYRGTQSAFGRTVAVKVLDLAVGKDVDRERFRRECRAIGSLSGHPNIVSVYDEGVLDDGRPYIVMEDLPHSLADQLADRGPLDWQSAIAIAIALAGALRSAHDSGVLHRDVKPENILISRHGVPKLSDFGLAQVSGGFESRTSTVRASVAHAAPELIDGLPVDATADVYSLASTAYQLVLGHPPFVRNADEGLITVINRVLREDPPSLVGSGVPTSVETVLRAAMAKNPADRPPDMATFEAQLREAQGGNEATAFTITSPVRTEVSAGSAADTTTAVPHHPPIATTAPTAVPHRRRRVLVAIGITTAAAVGIGTGLALTKGGGTEGSAAASSTQPGSTSTVVESAVDQTLLSILEDLPEASTFLSHIEAAQLTDLLTPSSQTKLATSADQPQAATVFAFADSAIESIPTSLTSYYLGNGTVDGVLLHHLMETAVSPADFPGYYPSLDLDGIELVSANGELYAGGHRIMRAIEGSDGWLYLLDGLLIPECGSDFFDCITNHPALLTWAGRVAASGFKAADFAEGPFTLFAPADEVLAAVDWSSIQASDFWLDYLVPGQLLMYDLHGEGTLTATSGLDIPWSDADGTPMIDGARIVLTIPTPTGVIQVLDAVFAGSPLSSRPPTTSPSAPTATTLAPTTTAASTGFRITGMTGTSLSVPVGLMTPVDICVSWSNAPNRFTYVSFTPPSNGPVRTSGETILFDDSLGGSSSGENGGCLMNAFVNCTAAGTAQFRFDLWGPNEGPEEDRASYIVTVTCS